ncbi:MAG: hypothetical protein KAJ19_29590 [Gammaproteobacteria bacterium]|nr:hypothetical protein [Gammaproteobacteria bacterium]
MANTEIAELKKIHELYCEANIQRYEILKNDNCERIAKLAEGLHDIPIEDVFIIYHDTNHRGFQELPLSIVSDDLFEKELMKLISLYKRGVLITPSMKEC